ncbi:hypothetical protein [Leptospira saintgironsiae]|uniref:Uncharacterized protein n=1 Tax=Leptospira saintgironsiae TaxID=2023183 RepID=A0A2M9Y7Y2_9LEPT|nr:hypothetical protein [Leptospira saintgironsiae]PJZ47602.1 hypothetical protein CH362_18375 [Leptospira saintgironsiae]
MLILRNTIFVLCFFIFFCKEKDSNALEAGSSQQNKIYENKSSKKLSLYVISGGWDIVRNQLRRFLGYPTANEYFDVCLELDEDAKKSKIVYADRKESDFIELTIQKKSDLEYSISRGGETLYLRKIVDDGDKQLFFSFDYSNVSSETALQEAKNDRKKSGKLIAYGSLQQDETFSECYDELQKKLEFQKEQETFGKEETQRHKEGKP